MKKTTILKNAFAARNSSGGVSAHLGVDDNCYGFHLTDALPRNAIPLGSFGKRGTFTITVEFTPDKPKRKAR